MGTTNPPTMNQVRAALGPDEIEYNKVKKKLGKSALIHLTKLAKGSDESLASKAVYLASLISSEESEQILLKAATSKSLPVRIAAVTGVKNMPKKSYNKVLTEILKNRNKTVREIAIQYYDKRKANPETANKVSKLRKQ